MLRSIFPLAVLACGWLAPAVSAQTPAQRLEAGREVTGFRVSPNPVTIARGDTILLTITLLDTSGRAIDGARFGILRRSNHFRVRSVKDSVDDSYLAWGERPGATSFTVAVQVPDGSGGAAWRRLDQGPVPVVVEDWPVARIDMPDLLHGPYVGTTLQLAATPVTTRGEVSRSARVAWSSDDPSVAAVTEGGLVTFARAATVRLRASTGSVSEMLEVTVRENPVRQLEVEPRTVTASVGDVVHFTARPLDGRGRPVEGIPVTWSARGLDSAGAEVFADGAFVAETPGTFQVLATAGTFAAEALVQATAREAASGVDLVGRGAVPHVATSDLWVFEGRDGRDYAYTGTHARGGGNRMFVWDVTDAGQPVLTDSVVVDGRVINDVKVNGDASWAIITREGASNRRNGMVVLDLAEPAHPTVLTQFSDSLTGGIHNVWINGDVVYAINDGTLAMHIIDMSNPAHPRHAGRWELRPGDQNKYLHDVWSDGRYAYLSYWDDGLVILDIGAGTHGGTPLAPTFVSRIAYGMGHTHTAYREGDYVFVGDEIFDCDDCDINGPRGYIHVMDVSDIDHPHEVAKFEVPEAGTHNIWVENGVLYIAYYQGGLRIVDVSGELRGDLYAQGRQIGWYNTSASEDAVVTNQTMAWGPQPFKGNVFVSDMNSGLWIVRHRRAARLSP